MSDSETDLFPSNMYNFRQESSTISAKGPNIHRTLSNSNLRSNMMSSTMLMPKNFGKQGFCEPSFYQNSMYNRREVSPMSLRSVPTMHRPNFNDSYSNRNNYTQRSVINGRGASPMSVRSFDSNASISAVDIAMALKNAHFNKYDMRIIKDAYNSFMKGRSRRRIEKRRKKRFRCERRQSNDSGEQGSNSSESSEDCRSVKTTTYRDNVSSSRSYRTDLSSFKQSLKESNIYKDCSDNFRQNTFRNTFSTGPRSINGDMLSNSRNNIEQIQFKAPRSVCSESYIRNAPVPVLKDRFKGSNSFLLPSQRFNSTKSIMETSKLVQSKQKVITLQNKPVVSYQTDSDEEDLVPQPTHKDVGCSSHKVSNAQRKRVLDTDEGTPNSKKRNKNASPKKVTQKQKEFEFVKPVLPIRKPLNGKTKETLISKSALPPVIQEEIIPPTKTSDLNDSQVDKQDESQNVTMRPSFIKRKLFSQKLDVTEAKNPSEFAPDSPQVNSYSALMKEKTKARKLVANQSCLSRDTTVNNNFLDLIHKIVPPERMNITNQTNLTNVTVATKTNETQNEKDATDPEDKWDVTSIIDTCDKSNVSDTFTDEEIFSFNTKTKTTNQKSSTVSSNIDLKSNENIKTKPTTIKNKNEKKKEVASKIDNLVCKVVINKVCEGSLEKACNKPKAKEPNNGVKNNVDNFFETDYETDSESRRQKEKATVKNVMKVVIKKPIAKLTPQSETPQQMKNFVKKLTPVPSAVETKRKPGLKNYFQRILKGKNKENEPIRDDNTNIINKDTIDCINNNNYVEKVKQIQEIVKKSSLQTKPVKMPAAKRDGNKINVTVERKTIQDKEDHQKTNTNSRSRRIRTPTLHNATLNTTGSLNELNQKNNKISTGNDQTTPLKKSRGRPKKLDTTLNLNTSMTLRVRDKQTEKDRSEKTEEKNKETKKKCVKTNKSRKITDNILSTSMTLRVRKTPVKNTSYVY